MNTTNEPQYRIYWRVGNSDRTGRSTATFSHKIAELWVNALNQDKDNKAVGLEYWMEEEQSLFRIAE